MLLQAVELGLRNRQETGLRQFFWLEQLLLAMSIASMLSLNVLLPAAFIRRYWEPNLIALAFVLALGAQIIGRWLFYKRMDERAL